MSSTAPKMTLWLSTPLISRTPASNATPPGSEHRGPGFHGRPYSRDEAFRHHGPGAAGKDIGEGLAIGAQRVDAEDLVLAQDRTALTLAAEADEKRRRRVRDRADRGRRE